MATVGFHLVVSLDNATTTSKRLYVLVLVAVAYHDKQALERRMLLQWGMTTVEIPQRKKEKKKLLSTGSLFVVATVRS